MVRWRGASILPVERRAACGEGVVKRLDRMNTDRLRSSKGLIEAGGPFFLFLNPEARRSSGRRRTRNAFDES